MRGDTRLVVITNLHSPSSVRTEEPDLRIIGEAAAARRARVLVDEVSLDAAVPRRSAVHLGPAFVCSNSLAKVYGLSGLRCVVPGQWFEAPARFRVGFGLAADLFDEALVGLARGLDDRG